jgi:sphingosine kinase
VAHVSYTIYKSKARGDITTMIKRLDVNLYDEFTCVGGDGTLYELIQGMIGRNLDWRLMIQKPISVIPAGSGNALASELGISTPEIGAFTIARGFYKSIDVATMIQKGQRMWSLISTTWGIVADIDQDTETDFMRKFGPLRYDLSAFKKILDHKSYNGVLEFVEEHDAKSDPGRWNIYESAVEKIPFEGKLPDGPPCKILEEYFYNELMGLLNKKQTKVVDRQDVKTIERDVFFFCATNVKYLTSQYLVGPKANMSDGCMDLILITKEMGWMSLLYSFMTDFPTGEFIKRKEVEYYKVKAFCLKPKEGGIAIDGELVAKGSTLLGEVHKGLLKVLTL